MLPFENRIIYDSLIAPYSVYFGGGIRSGLNDSYRDIQEREGITTTLLPTAESLAPTAVRKDIQARNKKILIAFQKDLGRAGLSPKMILEHVATIEKFAQAHLLKQKSPRGLLELLPEDLEEYIPKTHANPVSFKRFGQFLRDSGRIDYGQAEDLLDHIKSLRG